MRSRAAFKLIEIDDKARILKKGARVIDLGAAPGGWSQVAAKRVGAPQTGRVVAIDMLPMEPIAGVDFAVIDFLDAAAPDKLKAMLGGPADVVLSDMAANATGHARTDHLKIMALVEAAADFAREVLSPGGSFLAKVLQGGTEAALLAALKRDFATVKHVKPAASRSIGRTFWRRAFAHPAGDSGYCARDGGYAARILHGAERVCAWSSGACSAGVRGRSRSRR